jgi:hypothetical protein
MEDFGDLALRLARILVISPSFPRMTLDTVNEDDAGKIMYC